jgi:hypothetical protein
LISTTAVNVNVFLVASLFVKIQKEVLPEALQKVGDGFFSYTYYMYHSLPTAFKLAYLHEYHLCYEVMQRLFLF